MAKSKLVPSNVISNGSSYKQFGMMKRTIVKKNEDNVKEKEKEKEKVKEKEKEKEFINYNYRFIDLMNFAPGGCSLDRFCKMWKVSTRKGIFPYEWFDDVSKVNIIFYWLLKQS